jgi:hypothetical protein
MLGGEPGESKDGALSRQEKMCERSVPRLLDSCPIEMEGVESGTEEGPIPKGTATLPRSGYIEQPRALALGCGSQDPP